MTRIPPSLRLLSCVFVLVGTTACSGASGSCSGPKVYSPDGICEAHYYKSQYSEKEMVTQAMVTCRVDQLVISSGLLAFGDIIPAGMELEWQNDNVLLVTVPTGLEDSTLVRAKQPDAYLKGREIEILVQERPAEDELLQGCRL